MIPSQIGGFISKYTNCFLVMHASLVVGKALDYPTGKLVPGYKRESCFGSQLPIPLKGLYNSYVGVAKSYSYVGVVLPTKRFFYSF